MKKTKLIPFVLSASMLLSLVSLPAAATGKEPVIFGDMEGHWSAGAVDRWSGSGIFQGDENGNFLPDKEMTRAEFAQMLDNLMGYPVKAENKYADVPADAWYTDAVLKLTAAGVMEGDGSNAMPNAPISREQAAVLLCRALSLKPSDEAKILFDDAYQVSSWARDAVAALAQRDMIAGVGENNFAPALDINRASVAQMMNNMVSAYVTEDGASVTGEQKGIVIVTARDVKVDGAVLAEPLILAPRAAGATLTLAGETKAALVVLAAEGGKVMVEKEASADLVSVEAPKAELTVAGKVENVTVAPSASEAVLTVEKDGVIANVETAADKVAVKGPGKITSLTVTKGEGVTVSEETVVDRVANQSNHSVFVGGKELKPGAFIGEDSSSGSGSGGSGGSGGGSSSSDTVSVTYVIGKDTTIYAIAKGGSVSVPAIPADEEYFYTGKWTYTLGGDTTVYEAQSGDTIENVTAGLTLTAQAYEVKAAAPAKLTYTCENDALLITAEGKDKLVMNTYEVGDDAGIVEIGMEYAAPENAGELAVADTLEGLRTAQPSAPDSISVTVPFGKEGSVVKYLLWTDRQGEILAVEKITVQLAVDPAKPEE